MWDWLDLLSDKCHSEERTAGGVVKWRVVKKVPRCSGRGGRRGHLGEVEQIKYRKNIKRQVKLNR